MDRVKRLVAALDNWQRRHVVPGFIYAVIKKYGEDEGAYKGALITYYGFLSLFPLLLVATSILQLVLANDVSLRDRLVEDATSYFPVVGDQIRDSVGDTGRTGLALVIGLAFTLFGARGAADALQYALNHMWHVPRQRRPSFPLAPLRSLLIIVVGGVGLLAATALSAVAATLEDATWFRVVPTLVSVAVLFGVLLFVFKFGTTKKLGWLDSWPGALMAAVGIQLLQLAGNILLTRQLQNLSALYGTFAIVLGIMAWIYLQAQVILYAVEVNTVLRNKLWPRAIDTDRLTEQDKTAFRRIAKKERLVDDVRIKVEFGRRKSREDQK